MYVCEFCRRELTPLTPNVLDAFRSVKEGTVTFFKLLLCLSISQRLTAVLGENCISTLTLEEEEEEEKKGTKSRPLLDFAQ